MKKILFGIALAALPAIVAAETFECEMTSKGRGGFISDTMLLEINRAKGVGFVLDGVVYRVQKKPIAAELIKRSDTVWRFKWEVNDFPTDNSGKADLRYSAMLDLARKRIQVRGILAGYDNNISGSGPCKQIG